MILADCVVREMLAQSSGEGINHVARITSFICTDFFHTQVCLGLQLRYDITSDCNNKKARSSPAEDAGSEFLVFPAVM